MNDIRYYEVRRVPPAALVSERVRSRKSELAG